MDDKGMNWTQTTISKDYIAQYTFQHKCLSLESP